LFETLSELEAFASICNQAVSGDEEVEMIDFNQYAHLAKRLDMLVQKIEAQTKHLYSYQNIELNNKLQILYFVNSGLKQFSRVLMSLDKRDKEGFISNVKFAEELVAALSSHTLEDHSEEDGSYLEALTNFAKQASLLREAVETNFFADTSSIVDSGLAGLMVPGSFRDMDFVFHNTEGERSPGRQLFLQMLTLAYRWEQFNAAVKKDESIPAYKPEEVPYFASFIPSTEKIAPLPIQETDTPTIRLMKEPMKDPKEVKTSVPAFDRHPALEKEGSMKVLFSGPEQPNQTSDFRKELLF
ncbi:MAG: hypothetical protein KDK71_10625, partial [Chlamydiia bacterium]|nr:hypothetical protein [Chlamydiia bacterium]